MIPGTHTAGNHDFIFSDQGSRSSISKFLLDAVVHLHGDPLPREEAEVSFFQQGLKLHVLHGMNKGSTYEANVTPGNDTRSPV